MEGYVFDLEGDNLYLGCKKIWYGNFKSLDGTRSLSVHPFQEGNEEAQGKILEWIHSFSDKALCCSFNGLSYDHFVLWRLLGLKPTVGKGGKDYFADKEVIFFDAFYNAQFLNPNLPEFSLAALSRGSSAEKIDYRERLVQAGAMIGNEVKGFEFSFYNPLMDEYCDADVEATRVLVLKQLAELKELYGDVRPPSLRMGTKAQFLMKAQEHTGHGFDEKLAAEVMISLNKDMEELESEVLPKLPPRPLKKGEEAEYSMPAKPYKKDGSFSSHMENFISKHSGVVKSKDTVEFFGKDYKVEAKKILDIKLPMVIGDQQHFKEWLLSQGWVPTFYNFQRGPDGKPVRDDKGNYIETSPKLQEQGVICPNLLELEGDVVKEVVKFLSLRNRRSVLQGWLDNPRLKYDGRLPTASSKIANSHRQCHAVVCNVPRAGGQSLYGDEFRSLFCAEGENLIAAADASGLEQRVAGHMTFKYDEGKYAEELLKGDVHSKVAFAMFERELAALGFSPDKFDKEDRRFKPFRSKAKTAGYAILYGCSPAKLAKTLNKPDKDGKRLHKAFWDANPAMAQLVENIGKYWETKGKKTFVPAVDGRLLRTRSKHSLLNNILQSLGAIVMDLACCFMDAKLGEMFIDELGRPYYLYKGKQVRRVVYYHDEYSFECAPEVAEEVKKMAENSIAEAGRFFKLNVELAGEGKVGKSWQAVH
jgi:hypothetical protein